jgi:voltage-dependent potassium channel beta subunit
MEYRRLAESGVKLSVISLGGWTTFGKSITDERMAFDIIKKSFDAGVNHFDIADVYARGESERAMGKVFRELPRHHLVIATKVMGPMSDDVNDRGLSRKHIMEAIDASLKRIGTDYVDMYYCHAWDKETPMEESVRAMSDLVRMGKVLYWGVSNWTGKQIRDACELCDRLGLVRPQMDQPEYSMVVRKEVDEDVAPASRENGIGLVVYSPLACGVLTGKYDDGVPDDARLSQLDWLRKSYLKEEYLEKARALKAVADELGCTRAQLALAWAAAGPQVTSVITGATRPEQMEENLGALEVKLTDEVKKRIEEIL